MKKQLSPSAEISTLNTSSHISDQGVSDAYVYLLGRELVLKQQRLGFEKEGRKWNQVIHREPGGVAWANPNLEPTNLGPKGGWDGIYYPPALQKK